MLIRSLSGRLLLLTIVFVMLAEVLIFVPSIARFREDYLRERMERAQIASLALLATPNDMVSKDLEAELLSNAGVLNIALRRDSVRELILADMPPPVEETFDLRDATALTLMTDALRCLLGQSDRVVRVLGAPTKGAGHLIEITLYEAPLKQAMVEFGTRILVLSLGISFFTALLIFVSVRRFLVAPMSRVIDNMQGFRADPEDPGRVIAPHSGIDEIHRAETALAGLQTEVLTSLKQKARLAQLGEAVAKISHDLRNILTTAALFADRLEGVEDPRVKRAGPKLVAALDRAVKLCEATLNYGRAEEPAPETRAVALRRLAEDVGEGVFPDGDGVARFVNAAPDGLTAPADPDQLFRVLSNLTRNARQAIEASGVSGEVRIEATNGAAEVVISVTDTGPGLPQKARDHLFEPFKGGASRGGSGLGLAIADELTRLNGGRLTLVQSTTEGTRFEVSLPQMKDAAECA